MRIVNRSDFREARSLMLRLFLLLFVVPFVAFPAPADAKKKVLLIGQGPDGLHAVGTHEYDPGIRLFAQVLRHLPDLDLTIVKADGAWKEGPELIERADAIVLFVAEGGVWLK